MRKEQTKKLINNDIQELFEPSFIIKSPVCNQQGNEELLQKTKILFNNSRKKKIYSQATKLADLLLDMDCKEDTTSEGISQDPMQKSDINRVNLLRSIRLHNIIKKRVDAEGDELAVGDIGKFKRMKRENDIELIATLKKLGPPNFLKNKFKESTLMKYRVVNGKFFGVPC